jgi:DNA adenine methylase
MKITAIAPWFGGKRTLAKTIVEELGPHVSYFEPFCGSCAVLFAKEPSQQETVNDLHGLLINLARVLANPDAACELYGMAARTLYSEDIYRRSSEWVKAWEQDPQKAIDSEAAYHYFVCSWIGRNGTAGCSRTNWQPSVRFTPGGGSSAGRWKAAIDSIPPWHERLRNVAILNRDGFEFIEKIADDSRVAIYADPPYLMGTRGNGGGSKYHHDFDDGDHDRLAEALTRFKAARVVVSYYDDPVLDRMYAGWTKRKIKAQKNLHVQNRRGEGQCEAPEVLLINGPSYADQEGRLF